MPRKPAMKEKRHNAYIFFPLSLCLFTLSLMISMLIAVPWPDPLYHDDDVCRIRLSCVTVYFSCDLFQYLFLIIDGQRGKKSEWNGTEITAHEFCMNDRTPPIILIDPQQRNDSKLNHRIRTNTLSTRTYVCAKGK